MKLVLVAALLLFSPVHASADASVSVAFSKGEISIIAQWFSEHPKTSHRGGNGNKKPKGLPPGIAKNLARGKPLPPGIAKQVLPRGLIELLPPAPHGFERIVVDGKVLLVEVATRVVHDILADVILR